MDKCPTVELGVFATHLKKGKEGKDNPCSPKAKIKRRRDCNMRSNKK